jgi:general secretion pathway protein D
MRGKAITLAIAFCVLAGLSFGQSSDPNSPKKLDQNVVKVLRTTNKSQINRYVPKVYEFKNVNPGEFAHRLLNDFVKAENGAIDTYVGPDGKSGLVLIVVPEYQIPMADELMKNMDRKGLDSRSGTKWVYAQLKHRSVLDPGVAASLAQYGTNDTDTAITPDVKTNAVLVTGAPSSVDAIVNKVAEYDVPTAQVNVAARMYEVNITNDGQLGLDYFAWKNGPGRALFALGGYGEKESASAGVTQYNSGSGITGLPGRRGSSSGYNSAVFLDVSSAFFDFLAVKGKGNVLSEGSVSVLSSNPAFFQATQTIPYVYSVPASADTYDPANQVAGNQVHLLAGASGYVSPIQPAPGTARYNNLLDAANNQRVLATATVTAGITLNVTPVVATENILTSVQSIVTDITGYDGNGVPLPSNRIVTTQVRAKSGEEIVLGGINRAQSYKVTRKVPILGSIPVLGYLFGSESTSHKKTTVVQVITPTVVKGDGLNEDQKTIIQAGLELK